MRQGRWYCTGHWHPEGIREYVTTWQDKTELFLCYNFPYVLVSPTERFHLQCKYNTSPRLPIAHIPLVSRDK